MSPRALPTIATANTAPNRSTQRAEGKHCKFKPERAGACGMDRQRDAIWANLGPTLGVVTAWASKTNAHCRVLINVPAQRREPRLRVSLEIGLLLHVLNRGAW
jgi:hypothetical protein